VVRARYRRAMESELAKYAERELIEAARRMTPQQRLRAYVAHCRQMAILQRAGKVYAAGARNNTTSSPSDTQVQRHGR